MDILGLEAPKTVLATCLNMNGNCVSQYVTAQLYNVTKYIYIMYVLLYMKYLYTIIIIMVDN